MSRGGGLTRLRRWRRVSWVMGRSRLMRRVEGVSKVEDVAGGVEESEILVEQWA